MVKLHLKNISMKCYEDKTIFINFDFLVQDPKYNWVWTECSLTYDKMFDTLLWKQRLTMPVGTDIKNIKDIENEIKIIAEELKKACGNIKDKAEKLKYLSF